MKAEGQEARPLTAGETRQVEVRARFLYGAPGNGKTVISQAIRKLLDGEIAIPHAIEVEGAPAEIAALAAQVEGMRIRILQEFALAEQSRQEALQARELVEAQAEDLRRSPPHRPVHPNPGPGTGRS